VNLEINKVRKEVSGDVVCLCILNKKIYNNVIIIIINASSLGEQILPIFMVMLLLI